MAISSSSTSPDAAPLPAARFNPAAVGRRIRGIVFDMDGTLTVPCIDFAEMRRRVGVHPTEGDILKIIHGWDEARQKEAYSAIAEIEEQALRDMKVMAGAVELCQELDERNMPRAIVTRNVMSSVDFFHDTHFPLPPFHPSLSREWQPYKPDPASLHFIAGQWKVESAELVMIGDSCRDDIGAGANAGATTILIDEERRWRGVEDERLPVRPDFIVHDLFEARAVLHDMLAMVGGAGV